VAAKKKATKKPKFDLKVIGEKMAENGSVTISYRKYYIATKKIVDATLTLTDFKELQTFVKYITSATKANPQQDATNALWYLI